MTQYLKFIRIAFDDIRTLMSGGTVEPRSKEIRLMMREVYNIDIIPHLNQDRANLKQDRDKVVKNYKKSVENSEEIDTNAKQLELHF